MEYRRSSQVVPPSCGSAGANNVRASVLRPHPDIFLIQGRCCNSKQNCSPAAACHTCFTLLTHESREADVIEEKRRGSLVLVEGAVQRLVHVTEVPADFRQSVLPTEGGAAADSRSRVQRAVQQARLLISLATQCMNLVYDANTWRRETRADELLVHKGRGQRTKPGHPGAEPGGGVNTRRRCCLFLA